jgi:hypothetical protein
VKRLSGLGLLLLLQSCVLSENIYGQNGSQPTPPQKARLCDDKGCEELTWTGERYDSTKEGTQGVYAHYFVIAWNNEGVELQGKSRYGGDGVFPYQGDYHGKISAQGNSIEGGINDWHVGSGARGSKPFTLTWANSASNAIEAGDVAQFQQPRPSKTNPNIFLPPGASEEFVSYPDFVRAILQPEYALTPEDAKRACHDPYIIDANTALEITRYAYRAADMKRGDCWLMTAAALGSVRAKVIYATTFLYGWQGTPKDEAKGFGMLDMFQTTRDPWDIWLLLQCYIDGVGTPKDAHKAAMLTSYVLRHDDVYNVSQIVGADDAEKVREWQRLQVLMNPPTHSVTHCYSVGPNSAVPGSPKNQRCEQVNEVDNNAVQRQLNQINQQK